MHDDQKASEQIDQRAIDLAKAICDSAVSRQGAQEIYVQVVQILFRRLVLGLNSSNFTKRAARCQQSALEHQVNNDRFRLIIQRWKFGIDHVPIFADRTAGGD